MPPEKTSCGPSGKSCEGPALGAGCWGPVLVAEEFHGGRRYPIGAAPLLAPGEIAAALRNSLTSAALQHPKVLQASVWEKNPKHFHPKTEDVVLSIH